MVKRKALDALAAHHGLSLRAVECMLEIAEARPARSQVARFGVRLLHLAGMLSLAAGVVFFVAANWQALAVVGRFVLVEALLVVAVGVAVWRPPPERVGRYALLLAFLVAGALFALFGQTYQTGANVYELFLNWALLGLVFAVAAQWSVVWAAWTLVLNVALGLFCGWRPEAGAFWLVFAPWDLSQSQLLLVPLLVDVLLWVASVGLEGSPWSRLAPPWLGRFALSCAVGFGTWGGLIVVLQDGGSGEGAAGLIVPLLVFAAVVMHTLRRRMDVFPLAAVEGSLIVLSTSAIARFVDFDDTGVFFVLAAWLIVASAISGRYLMRLVRAWEETEAEA